MTVKDKQKEILTLFKGLTSLSHTPLPEAERDPRLHDVGILERGHLFSCFHEAHLHEAQELYELLWEAKDFSDFIHLCKQAREIVNEGLFVFAVSVAVLHRDDCHGVRVPPIQEIFPDRFIPAETINRALKADLQRGDQDVVSVEIEHTGNIIDPEFKLAYFREDIETNAHHWHWHLVYPANWRSDFFGKAKDRKGELFAYMHQQMCARYDCERLCTGLQRMAPFQNFEEELEGYAPHLVSLVSGAPYGTRSEGMHMHDVNDVDVLDLIRWRERILNAIHTGHVTDYNGKEVKLDEEHGIDILGSLIESSHDSMNKRYYGSLHNWSHVVIARIHDPDGRFMEAPGVMDDTTTSLRDPIFYRLHRFMDNIFQDYKHRLHPYTHDELDFPGIHILSTTVKSKVANVIHTTLKQDSLELHHGIPLKGSVKVKYEHLDHDQFDYSIVVDNKTGKDKHATARIFLAPKYDELGNRIILDEQRRMYIEMDKFRVDLHPGKNTITRSSDKSSVTITHVPTFDELEAGIGVGENDSEFCSCGWPSHMLVPRGTTRGMKFQLFVMLTDFEKDDVGGSSQAHLCSDALSYCGVKDEKYPDKRAMGFPFDRTITQRFPTQFSTHNMSFTDIRIQFVEAKHH
uniref:Hemocyanin subunit d n=1 Tax=Mastigoproctus giganteus TaxID=58767 RepID=G8YZS1_MASGI|nr:hemocyanin subunit d [Mastigoproctus giganteus]